MNEKQWYALGFFFMVATLIMSIISLNAVTQLPVTQLHEKSVDVYLIEMMIARTWCETWCALTALSCMAAIACWTYGWLKERFDERKTTEWMHRIYSVWRGRVF